MTLQNTTLALWFKETKVGLKSIPQKIFFSAQGFPIFLSLVVLSILFVLFRMKGIELDYRINETTNSIKKLQLESKELKAKKAKMLSVKNLRKLAQLHNLDQPGQEQIIIVP